MERLGLLREPGGPELPFEDVGVVGFNQRDQVGTLGFDHFGQGISAAFAAVEDVVGEEPQSTHVSSAPQFRFIIGQR